LIEQKAALDCLSPSEKADHKTVLEEQGLKREVCTDGTRVKILEDITKWANDRSLASPRVFWLTGQAGSSKTTVAYTIAKHFEEDDNTNQHTALGGIVIQITTKYSDILGPVKLIKIFESFKTFVGLYYYPGSIVKLSEDPKVHFKYIQAVTRTG
jgi:hypothetical protein